MTAFMSSVTASVMLNADTVKKKYVETGITIEPALTNPWDKAIEAMNTFAGETGLGLMNSWTKEGGFFDNFKQDATNYLESPWQAGVNAAAQFGLDVGSEMVAVEDTVQSGVINAKRSLASLWRALEDTQEKAANVGSPGGKDTPEETVVEDPTETPKTVYQETKVVMSPEYVDPNGNVYYKLSGYSDGYVSAGSTQNRSGILYAQEGSHYWKAKEKDLKKKTTSTNQTISTNQTVVGNKNTVHSMYAKGTMGTTKDEWAITDEPWLGDELTMYATPDGTLSYMRAGSTVIPADITENLVKWGQTSPDMASVTRGVGFMSNYISKPELNLSFDALVKADKITEDTLPEVKRFVKQEIDSLVKQLNYAIKGVKR